MHLHSGLIRKCEESETSACMISILLGQFFNNHFNTCTSNQVETDITILLISNCSSPMVMNSEIGAPFCLQTIQYFSTHNTFFFLVQNA
jgi:hypothetical protein